MTKTPEQMAEEYVAHNRSYPYDSLNAQDRYMRNSYLVGYKAAKPQWISVKERLPEHKQEVLIYTEGKDIYMARIYEGNEAYPISNGCGCCGSEERFTHWMLPEPPKEKK